MKKIWMPVAVACLTAATLVACKKDAKVAPQDKTIAQETLAKIKALGFSTSDVRKVDDGYLVEGDIVLNDDLLNSKTEYKLLRVGNEEQYRTTNLVTGLPRTIKILVSNLGTAYVQGTDTAIARYNALHTGLTFQRVTSGSYDINIVGFSQGPQGGYITLGSSGFPTATGNPYNQIKMNTNRFAYGSNPNVLYVGSVIQHEIGHCIGFRHTDYMDRSYSCGGTATNEGASDVGAILIPGTPSGPDANSWMLACSNGGNRTFNANDVTALNYLY
ncbi:MAG TPA: M57 family metalloprotease [Flavisolibacter sp.]|nr:M57 family metalloprotease [Flavisolibacter sp.]